MTRFCSGQAYLMIFGGLILNMCLSGTVNAQFTQQGSKLTGTGATGSAQQGGSLALSGDGVTALLGGPADDNFSGATWVFTRGGGTWSQQGGKLVGDGATWYSVQGCAVALSADGNTALIGGSRNHTYEGSAWVYTRTGGVWAQQARLYGTGAVPFALQGTSVALSADGNTALVGGPLDNEPYGAVWVFTRTGGVWKQQGNKLVGTGAVRSYQGASVALSADGNTAVVGGDVDNGYSGAVWIFRRTGDVWAQQGSKLVGAGAVGSAQQGTSVALSADGNTLLVGGHSDNAGAGAAWVFTRSGGVWSQQGSKLVGSGGSLAAHQGHSVALSADGNTAIIGGPEDGGGAGATWVFKRTGGSWSQFGSKLAGEGASGAAYQGASVALSSDGRTLLVGGWADNQKAGAAWVFTQPAPERPVIASDGVVNGASFLSGIAPGAWITIRGSGLSPTTRTWSTTDFSGNRLPTELDGVSVTVNGKRAYVYFVSPSQLNVLSPDDVTQGQVPVQVTTAGGVSNIVDAETDTLSPTLFTFSQQRGKYVAAVRADGAYLGPANLIAGLTTVAAKPGDTILLYGTGFGSTTPASPAGQVTSPAPLANQVTLWIGGAATTTQYAGLVSPGLYQFNLVVPDVANGDQAVVAQIGGKATQTGAFLAVQR